MTKIITRERVLELLRTLNLTSDTLIGIVMEDPFVLEEFVFLVTGKKLVITEVYTQLSIRQILSHSVVLDVYADTREGKIVHLEIQNSDDDDHVKRSRYNRACIDTSLLEKGLKYRELPDVLQIFVTKNDFLACDKAVVENYRDIYDGVTEFFFNLKYHKGDREELQCLQRYFLKTIPENESEYFPRLVERVRLLKYSGREDERMCEVSEMLINIGREEGKTASLRQCIYDLLSHLGGVPEDIRKRVDDEENEKVLHDWFLDAMNVKDVAEFANIIQ